MIEIFWNLAGRAVRAGGDADRPADPLAHPQIERMGQREIADLPLRPRWPAARPADGRCEPACC